MVVMEGHVTPPPTGRPTARTVDTHYTITVTLYGYWHFLKNTKGGGDGGGLLKLWNL